MPYRVRRLNWDLLTRPTMAGLATEAQANASLNRSVLGGLASIGGGIVQKRQEKESRRRSDRDFSLREDAFDLRVKQHNLSVDIEAEKRRDQQAADKEMLDNLGLASEAVGQEHAATGEVSPETLATFQETTAMAGGPELAQLKLKRRAEKEALDCGPGG